MILTMFYVLDNCLTKGKFQKIDSFLDIIILPLQTNTHHLLNS